MHFVLATYGTTGDVQPLLGLGVELRRRGHMTTFAAPPNFAKRVRSLGCDFVSLGPPMDIREMRDAYGGACRSSDPVQHVRKTLPLALRDAPQMITELTTACSGADVLISLPYQLAGRIVHELRRVPFISVHLSPFGGYSRRFSAETARQINELRACYGLKELKDPLGPEGNSSMLAIYAVSPTLFLRPLHWPEHYKITGFFYLEEHWLPDAELVQFLSSGEPPVVFSFGSMLHDSPEALGEIVLNTVKQLGRRAIVQRGWTGLSIDAPAEIVHTVEFVPHDWLFQRAACVVHAGGAGTTAATARAGVPTVIVPHMLDQFIWAMLLKERGCCSDTIPYSELTADRLRTSIDRALAPESRDRATKLAGQISLEAGVSRAGDLIEACLRT